MIKTPAIDGRPSETPHTGGMGCGALRTLSPLGSMRPSRRWLVPARAAAALIAGWPFLPRVV